MAGTFYGVGVGPGDPELMTLKAARLIRENEVIALPGEDPKAACAYQIAALAVPEIKDKELLGIKMPMERDRTVTDKAHRQGALTIETYLKEGENVVYLTLGDVSVYSSFCYLSQLVEADGYPCEMVSGVPSFCAAAAKLDTALGMGQEPIHVYPAAEPLSEESKLKGTVVFMKAGRQLNEVKAQIKDSGRMAMMVENCGQKNESVYRQVDEFPEHTGYYTLVIAKESE